ncbi:hypothetical protein GCM10010232_33610 [Streptomyces amakusaensis]
MAEAGETAGQPVHQEFGTAGGGIAEVAAGEEHNAARLGGRRVKGLSGPGAGLAQRSGHVLGHWCSDSSRGTERCGGTREVHGGTEFERVRTG